MSEVLRAVRLTGAVFFQWEVAWPYATPVPSGHTFAPIILPGAQQAISYHIVTHGPCWGGLIGGTPIKLATGDVLVIPHGDAYAMASSEEMCEEAEVVMAPALDFFRGVATGELPFVIREGEIGEHFTRVVCGFLGCDLRPFNPVVAALPRLVHLRSGPELGRLRTLLDFALSEAGQARPGGRSVLLRLSELMFVEVLRCCMAEQEHGARQGWLAGLHDPVVGKALHALHGEPARHWTLESLAREVAVSRSQLAQSFTSRVGEPPMHYLTQWRMQLAAQMLAAGYPKVSAVGREVGYESEAAFGRAFKRIVGSSPGEWRRRAMTGEEGAVDALKTRA